MPAGRAGVISKPASESGGGGSPTMLVPNGLALDGSQAGNGWVNEEAGAATFNKVADSNDETYLQAFSPSNEGDPTAYGPLRLNLATADFTSKTITSVQLWFIFHGSSVDAVLNHNMRTPAGITTIESFSNAGIISSSGSPWSTKPGGGVWDQTAIDSLQVDFEPQLGFDLGDWLRVLDVWVSVAWT